jgi:peptidoglycan/xylan/chitin deacetylase (PgdA/CDA1 family)
MRLLAPFSRSGAILCYHGLSHDTVAGSPIHLTLRELEAAIGAARDVGEIVPAAELVRRHQRGQSTSGLFALTFDDAYKSLELATALLSREQVPITVFAVPDALDEGRRFWWDRLAALLNVLSVDEIDGLCDQYEIPQTFRDKQGTAWGPGRPLRQWVIGRFAARWPAAFEPRMRELEVEKGIAPVDRSMTWEELAAFGAAAPVDIGVHTRSHPALPLLSAEEQLSEISSGHELLKERFPGTVPVLAAPFGLYNRDTVSVTRAAGLHACLSLGARTFDFAGDTGALPRFCMMHPESTFRLALRLSGVIDRARTWRGDVRVDFPVPPTPADAVVRY